MKSIFAMLQWGSTSLTNIGSSSDTAGADDRRGLNFVMLDVGWHVGSPSQRKHGNFNPELTYRAGRMLIINSCERTKNSRTILASVALW